MKKILRRAGRLSLRPWLHTLRQRPTRRLFLVAFLMPGTLIFALAVVWPAALRLSPPPPDDALTQQANTTDEACPAQHPSPAALDSLQAIETFLKARLALAQQDVINLAVNLTDSTLLIAIQGVPIREVPILHARISAAVQHTRRKGCLTQWVSRPFTLHRGVATIAKAPIRVVSAPRDTLEAQTRPPDEIPVENNETHFTLYFDQGLTLRVQQSSSFIGSVEKMLFDGKERAGRATRAIARLARGKAPEHELWITLELSPEDAKAVYRALPDNATLALRL